ncbi:MAG: carboxypeptidase regulatory-like domain-containing protein [Desulfurococcales archaeon]|nr:carboxypeptidase regulatory-like domain-containing protein [Desulfurococcales archaeon]
MERSTTKALVSILLVTLMVMPILSAALPSQGYDRQTSSNAWQYKFHPTLLSKVLSGEISDDDVVTVFFRLQELPDYTKAVVAGHHDMAVNALKNWAKMTQAQFIPEVYKHGGEVLNTFWIDNLVLVRAKMSVVKQLAEDPLVVEVLENFKVHVLDPVEKEQLNVRPGQEVESWGIFKIDAPGAWALGYTGEGVRIAVLDTGVDITHPALQGKMLTLDPTSPYYPGGWMEFDENGNPVLSSPHDTHGHGTHTSGTALGGDTENILIGVAPGATLMHGLVLPGGGGTFAQVLAGIEWAVDPYYIDPDTGQLVPTNLPAHVISMSLGASGYYGDDLFPGIEAALLANIVVVAAIGNDGQGTSSNPGNIWGVFGVGATDQYDNVAYFSSGEVVNWPNPPSEWPFYGYYPSQYIKPDFSAPGVSITSSVPGGGYEAWSGTSMATPHVAGTVALIYQATGWYEEPVPDTPERIYEILKNTSLDLGDPGQDTEYGWGRINASAAVALAEQYAKKTGVQGVVLDSYDNQPVRWAQIYVEELGKTYHVRPDGTFKIPLDPGTYHLDVGGFGYYNKTVIVNVTVENGTIAGVVTDLITGNPIAGALVTVVEANKTVTTNESGFFQVEVPAGTYTLTVEASGYEPFETTVSVEENETVFLTIQLTPAGYGTIEGYVFDAETMEPISNALVVVDEDMNYSAVTGPDGFYMIENVPAGIHVVEAYASGYQSASVNVTLAPNETVVVNFTLSTIPPAVVVLGDAYGHIPLILSSVFDVPVISYDNLSELLADWLNGTVQPAVIVVDHWNVNTSTPKWEYLAAFLLLTNMTRVPIVLLDTPYSGVTAVKALYVYHDNVTELGFPAPSNYTYDWPSPEYVRVEMLDPNSSLFQGVIPDNDSWFYLADLDNSSYADYIVFFNWSQPIDFVGNLTDDYNGITAGAVGTWISPGGSLWTILSSWAESYWMQYLEPGSDGMYSLNTMIVLINAVNLSLNYYFNTSNPLPRTVNGILTVKNMLSAHKVTSDKYTNVTIYLDRLPFGYVEGHVYGSDGLILDNATVKVLGTPVETMTNSSGYFKVWLPIGNYTIEISKDGYKTAYINVTVIVNETLNLGDIVLKRLPRIAILYDFNGELKSLIEDSLGWYVKDYSNATDFAEALRSGFFDAGIWAGYYMAPMPSYEEFMDVWDAINETGISVIFLDQWDAAWYYPELFGYGIRALNEYLGDPSYRYTDDYFGDIYIKIEQMSPIFKGYNVGDMVKILNYNTQGYGTDYAVFGGFSGTTLATLWLGGTTMEGDAIAYKVLDNGAKIILMASWAPEEYQDIQWWTEDMIKIFLNAVVWAASKPVTVTPSTVEAYVGDTLTFNITNAPANYTFNVSFDGESLGTVTTDATGSATFTLTVPVVPGGSHSLYFEGVDMLYYGQATIVVKAKISLAEKNITVPGTVGFNITGLPAEAIVHIYIDGNYLGSGRSDDRGVLEGLVNIPIVTDGTHYIKVLNGTSFEVIASTEISTMSYLAKISENIAAFNGSVSQLVSMLNHMNASLVSIIENKTGEVYALVNTTSGQIKVQLQSINGLVQSSYQDLKALLNSMNGTLVDLITTKTGDVYALVNTTSGQILVKLTDISNKIDAKSQEILNAINNLQSTLGQNITGLQQDVGSAKGRANAGVAVGSIGLITALAAIALTLRAGRLE